jgi:hypothetical protein
MPKKWYKGSQMTNVSKLSVYGKPACTELCRSVEVSCIAIIIAIIIIGAAP